MPMLVFKTVVKASDVSESFNLRLSTFVIYFEISYVRDSYRKTHWSVTIHIRFHYSKTTGMVICHTCQSHKS